MRMILASGSPRRKDLLLREGFQFEILPSQGEEKIIGKNPAEIVEALSLQKASEVAERLVQTGTEESGNEIIVIGADTVVSYQGKILGKPSDRAEAADMLRMLNGKTHQVYTGVTIIRLRGDHKTERTFHECTDVVFREAPDTEILEYVSTGEPMDKAGAYAIQGGWGRNVVEIYGDYDNVVGLPVARLKKELKELQTDAS